MSEERNSESLSNDFQISGNPQSEFESSPKPRPGIPLFAERKVPDDIQKIAQKAMFEQGKIQLDKDKVNSRLSSKRPGNLEQINNSQAEQPIMEMDEDSIASKKIEDNNDLNASKISKVDYLNRLPKKKSHEAEAKTSFRSKLPQNSDLLTSSHLSQVSSEKSDLKQEEQANIEGKNSTNKGYASFREEIMARLHDDSADFDRPVTPSPLDFKQTDLPQENPTELSEELIHPSKLPGFIHEPSGELDDHSDFQVTPKDELAETVLPAQGRKPRNPFESEEPEMSPALARALATRNMGHPDKNQVESIFDEGETTEKLPKLSRTNRVTISNEIKEQPARMSRKARNFNEETEEKKVIKAEKKDKKKSKVHLGRSIAIIFFALLLILGGSAYVYVSSSLKAVNPSDKTTQLVTIPAGTSSKNVASLLKKANLIKDSNVFNIYALIKGQTDFKSGSYNLSKGMTPLQIAQRLVKGGVTITGKITIPEGYTLDQISTAITINAASKNSAASPFSKDEFMKIVTDPTFIGKMTAKYPKLFANLPAANSGVKYQLEGYLFPATYDYAAGTSLKEVVEQMILTMDKNLQPYYDQMASLNLNVNQFISLAALVEKEANTQSDRKNVADVFLKRLNEGMALGSNVSLLYAEGKLGTNVTAAEDANVDTSMVSPFNLYTNQGTGPGPVVSPSAMSLDAVMNHTPNSYYYFIADSTGTVHFEATADEHDADVQQYLGGH